MSLLTKYDLIMHIMKKIVKCEGGYIEQKLMNDGKVELTLITELPYEVWCDQCKKRLKVKTKLMNRWDIPITIITGSHAEI